MSEYRTAVASEKLNGPGYWTVWCANGPMEALALLHKVFPDGIADAMNFVLFSTSGIHGSYSTIEEEMEDPKRDRYGEVTFLLVQPRIVSVTYGNVGCASTADVKFLKGLRATSWQAMLRIGR